MNKTFDHDKPNPARPDYLPSPSPEMLPSLGQMENPMNVGEQRQLGQDHAGKPLEYGHWTTKPKMGKARKTGSGDSQGGIAGIPGGGGGLAPEP